MDVLTAIKLDILTDDLRVIAKQGYIKKVYLYQIGDRYILSKEEDLKEMTFIALNNWKETGEEFRFLGGIVPSKSKKENIKNIKNLIWGI